MLCFICILDSTQKESAEKSICNRLGHVINAFHELLQAAMPVGPCIDAVLRAVNRLYLVLTLFVKMVGSAHSLRAVKIRAVVYLFISDKGQLDVRLLMTVCWM
jgi:hypothetical protein